MRGLKAPALLFERDEEKTQLRTQMHLIPLLAQQMLVHETGNNNNNTTKKKLAAN